MHEWSLQPELAVYFELYSWIWFMISISHSLKYQGKDITIKIFGIGMLYGFVLENGGPIVIESLGFIGYFSEDFFSVYLFEINGVGIRVSQVPVATHISWSSVFYLAYLWWKKISEAYPSLKNSCLWGGLIMSLSGLLYDIQLDVIATRLHWWTWNPTLKAFFFGVPLVNFIAWFWAMFVFALAWCIIHLKKDKTEKEQRKMLFIVLPVLWVSATVGFTICTQIANMLGWIYK